MVRDGCVLYGIVYGALVWLYITACNVDIGVESRDHEMNVLHPAFEEDSYVIPLRICFPKTSICLVIGGVCMPGQFQSGH